MCVRGGGGTRGGTCFLSSSQGHGHTTPVKTEAHDSLVGGPGGPWMGWMRTPRVRVTATVWWQPQDPVPHPQLAASLSTGPIPRHSPTLSLRNCEVNGGDIHQAELHLRQRQGVKPVAPRGHPPATVPPPSPNRLGFQGPNVTLAPV